MAHQIKTNPTSLDSLMKCEKAPDIRSCFVCENRLKEPRPCLTSVLLIKTLIYHSILSIFYILHNHSGWFAMMFAYHWCCASPVNFVIANLPITGNQPRSGLKEERTDLFRGILAVPGPPADGFGKVIHHVIQHVVIRNGF